MVSRTLYRGLPAWLLTSSSSSLRVVVSEIGGHIASITHTTDDVNPLWNPPWKSMNFFTTPVADIEKEYGDAREGRLLSGIMGHNLCLDRFGAPWPDDSRPFHGEAGVSIWTLGEEKKDGAVFHVTLPVAGIAVSRSLTLHGDDILMETSLKPVDGRARHVEWCEHVTIGDPFLDGVKIEAGIDAAWNWPSEPEPTWRFPSQGKLGLIHPAEALAVPLPSDPPCGDVVTSRVTKGFFRAHNVRLGKTLQYSWDADSFPWLCLWTEHKSRQSPPWNGITRTRGLEFSTKPFPEGEPPAERSEVFMGRPARMAVGGEGRTEKVTITWS